MERAFRVERVLGALAALLLAVPFLATASFAGDPAGPKPAEAPDWVGKVPANYKVEGERVFQNVATVEGKDADAARKKAESDGVVGLEGLVAGYLERMAGECVASAAEKKVAVRAAGVLVQGMVRPVKPAAEWRNPDDSTTHLLFEFKLEKLKEDVQGAEQLKPELRSCLLGKADEMFDLGMKPGAADSGSSLDRAKGAAKGLGQDASPSKMLEGTVPSNILERDASPDPGEGAPVSEESGPRTEPVPEEPQTPLNTVKVSTEAESWRPFSVTKAQELGKVEEFFEYKLERFKLEDPAAEEGGEKPEPRYEYKGTRGSVKVFARSYRGRPSRTLVVSVFPEDLAKFQVHLELHFKVVKGSLKAATLKAITVERGARKGRWDDSLLLRAKGVPFMEELPRRSKIAVEALEARASKRSLNVGRIRRTRFTDPLLGWIRFAYNRQGVTSGDWLISRPQMKGKPKKSRPRKPQPRQRTRSR